jgi:hypothetical protein
MAIALLALLALGAVRGRELQQAGCTKAPGAVCTPGQGGTVDGERARCVQPIRPGTGTCAAPTLLNFLSYVVAASSAGPNSGSCEETPCCDATPGVPSTCASVTVGCIADVKLCVAGAVGTVLQSIVGPALDITVGPGPSVG